jgi:hypothetical protein
MRTTIKKPAEASSAVTTVVLDPVQPPISRAASKPAVRKVTFGVIAKKKETTKSEYPIIPDPTGEIYALAKTIKQQSDELDSLEGALEANKAALKQRTLLPYFQIHSGKTDVPSSVSIPTTAGEVLVTFSSRYKKMDNESSLIPILGDEMVAEHFKQAFTITINGEKLSSVDPGDPERSPAQEFLDALQELISNHNASDAVTYKQEVKRIPREAALPAHTGG